MADTVAIVLACVAAVLIIVVFAALSIYTERKISARCRESEFEKWRAEEEARSKQEYREIFRVEPPW